MLCKKCKTALPEGATKCALCGAANKRNVKASRALAAVLLVIAAAGAVYLFFSLTGRFDTPEDGDAQETPQLLAETGEPAPGASPANTQKSAEPGSEGEENSRATEDNRDPLFVMLAETAAAAEAYINSRANTYISNKGFLYDPAAGYLTRETLETDVDAMILYLRPVDLSAYIATDSSYALRVFAAREDDGRVALADAGAFWGYIHRDELNAVLAAYDTDHGVILRPAADSAVYRDTSALAESYTFSEYGYDMRYLSANEKYAVAVMTERSEEQLLRCFVFEYADGVWTVGASGLEDADNLAEAVNAALPDVDMALLPGYTPRLAVFNTNLDAQTLLDRLVAEGVVTEGARAVYASANDRFAYVVTDGGERVLIRYIPDIPAQAYAVAGYAEAEEILKELGAHENAYLLLQE